MTSKLTLSRRADRWQLRTRELRFSSRPLLMGIINVTPDSFSDGGRYFDPPSAVEHALQLQAEGANLIDIGGESSRPGSEPVSADEELRRVVPVFERLQGQLSVPLSIDTTKAVVAEAALALGAEIINDISGLSADPQMAALAARTGCGVCVMHMQGAPKTMQLDPRYEDVSAEVYAYLQSACDRLVRAGVAPEQIAIDPGIGFGKRLEHNLALLRGIDRFHQLGRPILVGPSRKRFIGEVLGDMTVERDSATIGVCLALAQHGVQVLRVHSPGAVARALALWAAVDGADESKDAR